MENFLKEAHIIGTIKKEVPEIIECEFSNEAIKTEHFGYIVASVQHSFLKKIVITKEFVFHLIMVQKLKEVTIALYAVYLNI